MLRVKLLGQFDVRRENAPIAIPSRPTQSLLAFLLLNAGVAHRREKLAGLFWPDATEENARSYLRQGLWRLRKAIEARPLPKHGEPYVLCDDISIAFNAKADYWLDASILEQASGQGASADDLIGAASVYRGDLLPGFYDDWVVLERERLRSVFEQKMGLLLDRLQKDGRWSEVCEWAERWIALGQSPEAAYRALMLAHSQAGEMSQVVAIYQRGVESLRNDLGVEPSEQTRQLLERLKRGEPAIEPEASRPVKLREAPPHNLPVQLTSFIGREKEVAEIKRLLATTCLLTLTGAGGIGKTRLALQVGADLLDDTLAGTGQGFGDGVWLIELASLSEPALVPHSVVAALGLREEGARSPEGKLLEHLRGKNLLLILDNCEHMVEACARLAATLLHACPHLKILASSREALNIGGEIAWRVPSLSLPAPESLRVLTDSTRSEAIQLFVERAQHVLPTFSATEANIETVAQICHRLDGLPLAIELAAARVDMLSLEEINQGMDHRFRLLTGGDRAELPRHQTLAACLDWSWNLLSADEQTLFRRLSILAGTWTLEDAEQVCSDEGVARARVLDLLTTLVRKSLVSVEGRGSVSRYRLLETIRYYASDRLKESGEYDRVAARHRDWFLQLAETFESDARQKKPTADWTARLASEVDNLRAALEWSENEAGGADKGLRLSGALGGFWERQSALTEGREWLGKFLDLSRDSSDANVRAQALYAAGRLAQLQDDHANAIALFGECLQIEPQDDARLAQAHLDLGFEFYRSADHESAAKHYHKAIELGERIHDAVLVALADMRLGMIYHEHGDLERAVACHRRSLEAFRLADHKQYMAAALSNLARACHQLTDYDQAIEYYAQVIEIYEGLGKHYNLCVNYNNIGEVLIDQGSWDAACGFLSKCLHLAEALQNNYIKAVAWGNIAICKLNQSEPESAVDYATRALELIQQGQAKDQEGILYRKLGEIRTVLGKREEAERDFEEALKLLEPLQKKSELARLYRHYGKFLMSEASKRAQGVDYLERALELFQALGSAKEVEQTEILLHGLADQMQSRLSDGKNERNP